MPQATPRPWSTQYSQDYRGRQQSRPTTTTTRRRPKSAHVPGTRTVRTPAATMLVPPHHHPPGPSNIYAQAGTDVFGLKADMGATTDIKVTGNRVSFAQKESRPQTRCRATKDAEVQVNLQTDKVEPRIPEPGSTPNCTAPIDNVHWICWPEPRPAPPSRPQTSLGFRRSRPADGDYITRDDIDVVNHVPDNMKLAGYVQPMNFDPDFNSWENCSRKDGLQNMGTSQMRRSDTFHHEPARCPMTSISVNNPPFQDNYTAYNGPRPSYAGPNGYTQQPHPQQQQEYGVGPMNDMMVNGYSKRIEGHPALPSVFCSRFNKYPLLSRQPRYPAYSDDYMHQYSMFQSTTPRVTGHFIIHPDWVSEKGGLRRSRSMIQHQCKQRNGDSLRY